MPWYGTRKAIPNLSAARPLCNRGLQSGLPMRPTTELLALRLATRGPAGLHHLRELFAARGTDAVTFSFAGTGGTAGLLRTLSALSAAAGAVGAATGGIGLSPSPARPCRRSDTLTTGGGETTPTFHSALGGSRTTLRLRRTAATTTRTAGATAQQAGEPILQLVDLTSYGHCFFQLFYR